MELIRIKEMKPSRIWLIRHAQSLANVDSKIYYEVPDYDIALSKMGESQLPVIGKQIQRMIKSPIQFRCSTFRRARQTLGGICDGLDSSIYNVEYDPRLRERDWSPLKVSADIKVIPDELFRNFYYRFPGGESGADTYNRFCCYWLEICTQKNIDCEEVWVTHGEIMKIIKAKLTGSSIDCSLRLPHPKNGEIWGFELMDDGLYRTRGHWRPK